MIEILDDNTIEETKAEAERLSWTHKSHPRFEKEKYLLEVGLRDALRQIMEWGEEDCHHHALTRHIEPLHKKRECVVCLQELKQEISDDTVSLHKV